MLEKPNIPDAGMSDCLKWEYGLEGTTLQFLPIGNDINSYAFTVTDKNQKQFFLKVRRNEFNEAVVKIPRLLENNGVHEVIAPIPTNKNELWTKFEGYYLSLFPYISGKNGFELPLTEERWKTLGSVLHHLHTTVVPPELQKSISQEAFVPFWREKVQELLQFIENRTYEDRTLNDFAEILKTKKELFLYCVDRAEALANALQKETPPFVLCHADIHAGNVLTDESGMLYVVDWDTLLFAPKERDLMFVGGGVGGAWNTPEEERSFYIGYGYTDVNQFAIAYYRFERIIEDVASFSEQVLSSKESTQDKERWLKKFGQQFLPGNVVEIALKSDPENMK